MRIAIASDHAGFSLKESLLPWLQQEHEIIDFGAHDQDPVDYPDTGFPAARAVASGDCERGILICGAGIGMSIVGNKVPGVRAALCHTREVAVLSRRHNNANVLTLAGRYIAPHYARQIITDWLSTDFSAGRHQPRVDKIMKQENMRGAQ
ncbi:MAG: ribose 5-phosphate isomerase B [Candidatus Cloacimonetes bacterium]|nr:ribose 5-phosphate isomerase B [Candidatus Cloacimonadota bacterium]